MPGPHPPSPLGQRILDLLGDGEPRSTTEIAAALEADPTAIRGTLHRLRLSRRIVRVGERHEAPLTAASWAGRKPVRHVVWGLATER